MTSNIRKLFIFWPLLIVWRAE